MYVKVNSVEWKLRNVSIMNIFITNTSLISYPCHKVQNPSKVLIVKENAHVIVTSRFYELWGQRSSQSNEWYRSRSDLLEFNVIKLSVLVLYKHILLKVMYYQNEIKEFWNLNLGIILSIFNFRSVQGDCPLLAPPGDIICVGDEEVFHWWNSGVGGFHLHCNSLHIWCKYI